MSQIKILTPLPPEILRAVEEELGRVEGLPTTFDPNAIGFMFVRDDEPFLILVFDNFYFCGEQLVSTAMTVIGDLKNVGRGVLYHMSYIPFHILGAIRCIVAVKSNNLPSVKAIEKYGFILEGTFDRAADGVNDVMCYRLTAEESKWLNDRGALEAAKIPILTVGNKDE